MKHFVLAAHDPSVTQQNAITNLFRGTQYGYWHWIPNVWLIASPSDSDTAEGLRETVRDAVPNCPFILLHVEPTDWAGWADTRWAEWLENSWRQEA